MLNSNRIKQSYIRLYPNSKHTKSWAGVLVHIQTEHGVWRWNGQGYTYENTHEAWVLPFEEALKQVAHCGPEKEATFIRAVYPYIYPLGSTWKIPHDDFEGSVIGYYTTREGKEGVNLQQIGTRVVHVYGTKWLKP